MVKVSKYLKNVTKSMGYALYSTTKDSYSTVADFAETNSDLFKTAYSDLKNYKTTYQRVMTQFKNSKVFVASKLALQSVKEDLKTGDFYNKARQDAFAAKYSGLDISEDDFDIADFGFDEDSDWDINDGDTLVSKVVSKSNKLSSILISDTIIKTSSAQIDTQKEIASMQYAQNIELTKSINRNIENLGMNLDNRFKDFATMAKVNSENAVKFYDTVGKSLNEIATDIKFLADVERKRQDPNFGQKEKTKKPGQNIEDIAPSGIVDLRAYGGKIKSNAKNMLNRYIPGMDMLFGDNNMLAMLAANPMQLVSEAAMKKILTRQNELMYNLDNFNQSLEGLFPALIGRFNTLADKDEYSGGKKTWQLLGELFGIKNEYTTKIDTKQFNKGATSWDGISKKYLEEVIPFYLRKMTAALTGEREMIFDPENGRWTTVSGAVKSHAQQQFQSSQSAFSEFNSELNYFLKDTRFKRGADKRRLEEELPILYKVLYNMGDIDLKDKRGSELGVSEETLNIFRAAFEAMPNSIRMSIVSNINQQKKEASDQLKKSEELGDLLYKFAAEGIDINKYDHKNRTYKINGIDKDYDQYGDYKIKDNKSPIAMGLVRAKDKYDKTIFDYLKGIKDEFEYLRQEGMYVYGNIGNGGSGGGGNTRRGGVVGGNGGRIFTHQQEEANKKLNFDYTRQKTSEEIARNAVLNRDESYERNVQNMMDRDDAWKYQFVGDLSEDENVIHTRNTMYNTAKKREDKRKQDWLDERTKDSVFRDIFGLTQDRVYRKKFDQYSDKKFSEKFEHADTFGEKFFLVKDEVESWLDKPSAALNRAVLAADNHLYNMLYKSSMQMVDDEGKPIEGFLDLLKFKTKETFTNIRESVTDWFGNARTKFQESPFGQWLEQLKENILGSQTGEGHRDKFFPALMDALKKNSEDVFNMYKEAFRKSALDSGLMNEDEDGNLTFKSAEQTDQERYDNYEREYRRHADAQSKIGKYDQAVVDKIRAMDSRTIELHSKRDKEFAKAVEDVRKADEAEAFFKEFNDRVNGYTGDQRTKYEGLRSTMNQYKQDLNADIMTAATNKVEKQRAANKAAQRYDYISEEVKNLQEVAENKDGIWSADQVKQAKKDLEDLLKEQDTALKEKEKAIEEARVYTEIQQRLHGPEREQLAVDAACSHISNMNDNILISSMERLNGILTTSNLTKEDLEQQKTHFKNLKTLYENECEDLWDAVDNARARLNSSTTEAEVEMLNNAIDNLMKRINVITHQIIPAIDANIKTLTEGGDLLKIDDITTFRSTATNDLDNYNIRKTGKSVAGIEKLSERSKMTLGQFDPEILNEFKEYMEREAMQKHILQEFGDASGQVDESKLNKKQLDAYHGYLSMKKRVEDFRSQIDTLNLTPEQKTEILSLLSTPHRTDFEQKKYEQTIANKFQEFKNLKEDETPTMARGGINRTGKAFRSIVSSGELINGRMVPPGGPYITTIPRNGVVINPNSESTIKRQAREEKAFARGLKLNAEANDGLEQLGTFSPVQTVLKENFEKLFQKLDVITGENAEDDVIDSRITDKFQKFISDPTRLQDAFENPLAFAMSTIISNAVPKVTRTINDKIIPWVDAKLRRNGGNDEDLAFNAEANDKLTDMVPQELKDFADAIGKNVGINGLAKGILGMGAGGILMGMPLLGAGIGVGSEIVKNNDSLNSTLFGTILAKDENGNVVRREYDGIISEAFQKAFPDAKAYGLTGSILGMLTPLGPLGGMLVGAGLGFAKNTEVVQEGLFGEDKLFSPKNREKMKKALPKMGLGAAVGALALGGPFGLLGGSLLGAGAGLVSSTDKFKDIMFGEDDGTGKREGGIVGQLKEQFLTPMKDFALSMVDQLKHTLLDDFLKPLVDLVPTITNEMHHFFSETLMRFPNWVKEKLEDGLLNPIGNLVRDKIINPAKTLVSGIFKGIFGIIKAPFKLVGKAASGIKGHFDRKAIRGGYSKMSAAERNDERRKHWASFGVRKIFPFHLLGRDKYEEFDEELEGLTNRSSTDQLEDLRNSILGNIGDTNAFRKALMANQRKTSAEISEKFKTTFSNGTANKIEKYVRKGDSESLAKAAKLIREADTINGDRLSKEDADNLINKIKTNREERDNIETKMQSYMGKSDEDIAKLADMMGFKGIKNGKLTTKQKQKLVEMLDVEINSQNKKKSLMGDEAYNDYKEAMLNTTPTNKALDEFTKNLIKTNKVFHDLLDFDNIVGERRQEKLESAEGYENAREEKIAEYNRRIEAKSSDIAHANEKLAELKKELSETTDPVKQKELKNRIKQTENWKAEAQEVLKEAEESKKPYLQARRKSETLKNYNASKMRNAEAMIHENDEDFREKLLAKYFDPIAKTGYYDRDQLNTLEEKLTDELYDSHAQVLLKITKRRHIVEDLNEFFKVTDEKWLNRIERLGEYADINKNDIKKLQTLSDSDMRSLEDYLKTDPNIIRSNDVPKLRQLIATNGNRYEDADMKTTVRHNTHSIKGRVKNFINDAGKGLLRGLGATGKFLFDAEAKDNDKRDRLKAEIRKLGRDYEDDPRFRNIIKKPEVMDAMSTGELEDYKNLLKSYITRNIRSTESSSNTAQSEPIPMGEPIPTNAFADMLLSPLFATGKALTGLSNLIAKRQAKRAAKRRKLQAKINLDAQPATFAEKALEVIAENTGATAEAVDDVVQQQEEAMTPPAKGSKEEADAKMEEEKKYSFLDRMKGFFHRGDDDDDDEKKPSLFSRIKNGIAKFLGKALFGISVFGGIPILVGFTRKYVIPFFKEKVGPWLIGTKTEDGTYEGGVLSPLANSVSTMWGNFKNWVVETGWPAVKSGLRDIATEAVTLWKDGIETSIEFAIGKVLPTAMEMLAKYLPTIIWHGIKGLGSALKDLFGKDDISSNETKVDTSLSEAYNNTYGSGNTTSKSDLVRGLTDAAHDKQMSRGLVGQTAAITAQNKNYEAYQEVNSNEEEKAARSQFAAEKLDLENNESYRSIKDSAVNEAYADSRSGMSMKEQGGRMLARSIVTGGKEVVLLGKGISLTGKLASKIPLAGKLLGGGLKALGGGVQGIGKVGGTIKALGKGTATVESLASGVAKNQARSAAAARKAAAKSNSKLATKICNKIKDALTKLIGNPKVAEKTTELGAKSSGKLATLVGKISEKLVPVLSKFPVQQLAKILGKIAVVVMIVTLVADFISGWDNAATILGIVGKSDELLVMERLLAALSQVIANQLLFGFVPAKTVADWILEMDEFVKFGGESEQEMVDDIKKRRDEAEAAIEAYNIENGTSFEGVEEINLAVNTTKLQKAHNKVTETVEKMDKSALGGYKQYEELRKKADAGSKWAKVQLAVNGFTYGIAGLQSFGALNDYKRYEKIYAKEHADELAGLLTDEESSPTEEVATNAEANDKLKAFGKGASKVLKYATPFGVIDDLIGEGKNIASDLKKLSARNKSIRTKIAQGKISIASKDYWKIVLGSDSDNSYASSLFRLSEYMERVIKAPVLAIQNVIDSVVTSETGVNSDGTTASTTAVKSSDNITSTSSSSTTTKTAKKSGLKATVALGASLVTGLVKGLFGKGVSGTGKQYFHGLKHKYAIPPTPLTDDDASFIKSQYSGGGHLYQRDYNDRFNIAGDSSAQSIADSGCGPVVASELLSRYGKNYDVHEAARAALKYKEKDGGTFPEYFHDYLGKKGIRTSNINSPSEVKRRIKSGESVILMGQSGTGKTPFGFANPHYVLATGMSNGNIIIQDPEDPQGNALYNANDTINDSIYAIGTSGMGRRTRFGGGKRLSGRGPALTSKQMSTLYSILHEITLKHEGGGDYTVVCGNDNGSVSFGSIGFHATLAKQVLEQIAQRVTDPTDKATLQRFATRSETEVFNDSDCDTLQGLLTKYSDISKDVQDSVAYALLEENNMSHPLKMYNAGRLNNPLSMLVPADIYNTGIHNGWAEDYAWKSTTDGVSEIDQVTNQMLTKSWWANSGSQYTNAWLNRIKDTASIVKGINLDTYTPGSIVSGYTGLNGSPSGVSGSTSSSSSKSSGILGLFKNYAMAAFKKLYGSKLVTMLFGDDSEEASSTSSGNAGGYEGTVNTNGADGWFLETLAGSSVSSGYRTADRPDHGGIDYAAGEGTPIYCPVDGVVCYAEWNTGGYGNLTIVQDTHGYYHIFGHQCQQPPVKNGQEVVRGDLVGYVGNTGESYGAHLHYQVNRPSDMWHADVDPNKYDYSDYIESARLRSNATKVEDAYKTYGDDFVGPVTTDKMPSSGKGKKTNTLTPGHVTVTRDQLKAIQEKTLTEYEKKKKRSGKGSPIAPGSSNLYNYPSMDSQITARSKMNPTEARKHQGGPSTVSEEALAAIVKLLGNISVNTYNLNEVVALLSKLSINTAQTVNGTGKTKSAKGTEHVDDTQGIIEELVKTLAKTNSMNMHAFNSLNSKIDGSNSSAMQAVYSIAGQ